MISTSAKVLRKSFPLKEKCEEEKSLLQEMQNMHSLLSRTDSVKGWTTFPMRKIGDQVQINFPKICDLLAVGILWDPEAFLY